jgi:hypothetical protein
MSVRCLSFSLSGKDGDSNRLQPARQNPYHTPVWVCTSLAWVTIHPIRKWVWTDRQSHKAPGTADARQLRHACPRSKLGSSGHAYPRSTPPLRFVSCLPMMRTIVQTHLERGTWLHSQNKLSGRYVQGMFNLNQGPDNEAVLNWHKRDQRTSA